MGTFGTLYAAMSGRRRRQLALTGFAMLAGAVAELVAIGAVFPFLALLTRGTGGSGTSRLPLPRVDSPATAALILVAAALLAAAVRLVLLWLTQKLVAGFAHDLARAMFGRMIRQPYADYVRRNSSEVIAAMEKVRDIAGLVLQPLMQAAVATVMALFIAAFLFLLSPVAATGAALSLGLAYLAIARLTRRRLAANSTIIGNAAAERVKLVQEALGGIRDIILDRSHTVYEEAFTTVDSRLRRALTVNTLIGQGPRFAIEAAGMIAIALVALWMSGQPGGLVRAIPVLGALAVGAQRLLPLIQQAYLGWSATLGNRQALADIAAILTAPALPDLPAGAGRLPFRESVLLRGASFAYEPGRPVLHGVDLDIPRGARIGIVGETGAGKSTLLDLLMGLLEPTAGEIRVDGRLLDAATRALWQGQVAHVPQAIYLADESIAANIAFGVRAGEIDSERVRACAEAAHLAGFVGTLPEGYDTLVGERGIRLSGGQRQRIGIARALYKQASVLILDEATSALDDATEAAVIASIAALGRDITLVMIAHRRSTLQGCDRIVRVENGRVAEEPARRRGAA
jgi:ABC-type multidrug transport system fused ATPase/permease subunit